MIGQLSSDQHSLLLRMEILSIEEDVHQSHSDPSNYQVVHDHKDQNRRVVCHILDHLIGLLLEA